MMVPWRDRRGRFLPFTAAVLAAVCVPGLLTAFWWTQDELGARPVTEAIHEIGLWAIRFVMIALAVTPLRAALDWGKLLLVRRMLGVTALAYAVVHFSLYIVQQNGNMAMVVSEIVHRFYLTIGFAVLLGLIALGITSTDSAVRRMGRWWKRLHRLAYPLAVLALLHYFIQSKANVSEPVFVAGLYVWLMLWRVLPVRWQRTRGGVSRPRPGFRRIGRRHRVRMVRRQYAHQSVARAGGERDAALRPPPGALRGAGDIGAGCCHPRAPHRTHPAAGPASCRGTGGMTRRARGARACRKHPVSIR